MFKNCLIYQIETTIDLAHLASKMPHFSLQPCLEQEMESIGFMPLYPNNDTIFLDQLEQIHFFKVGIEKKILTRSTLQLEIEKLAKEREVDITLSANYRELKEMAKERLMPQLLSTRTEINAYIDSHNNWLVIDAATVNKSTIVTSLLRKTLGSLPVVFYSPKTSISQVMTSWMKPMLEHNLFSLGEDILLEEQSEPKGKALIKNVALQSDNVLQYIEANWLVTKLKIQYQDYFSFRLTNNFILHSIKFLNFFREDLEDNADDAIHRIRSEYALMGKLFREVFEQLHHLIDESAEGIA